MGDAEKLKRFEQVTAVPMLVLALAIIPLLIIPLLFDLPPAGHELIIALDWMIWGLFAVEYIVRLWLAPRKRFFIMNNKIDLFVLVLPFLRPLRVLRSARALRVLRAVRAVAFLARGAKALRVILTRHKLNHALTATLAVVIGAALLVESFERGAEGSNITGLADALWWAATTVTTVGYGDRFPVTAAGRGVGVALMVIGVALFGFLAGSVASYFLNPETDSIETDRLAEVLERLDRIEENLREKNPGDPRP